MKEIKEKKQEELGTIYVESTKDIIKFDIFVRQGSGIRCSFLGWMHGNFYWIDLVDGQIFSTEYSGSFEAVKEALDEGDRVIGFEYFSEFVKYLANYMGDRDSGEY